MDSGTTAHVPQKRSGSGRPSSPTHSFEAQHRLGGISLSGCLRAARERRGGLEELGVVAKGEGRFLCARGVPGVSGSLFKGATCGVVVNDQSFGSRTSLRFPLFSK